MKIVKRRPAARQTSLSECCCGGSIWHCTGSKKLLEFQT
jgi:hypothetical protein